MKFMPVFFLSSAVSLIIGSMAQAGPPPHEVLMKSLSYSPKQLVLAPGDSVVWKNTAYTEHSATSDSTPPEFDTGMIGPGKESKAVHFEKAGTYVYHCSLHGMTMSGTVIVKSGSPK